MTKAKLPRVVGVPLMSAIKCATGLSGMSYLEVDPPMHMVISWGRGGSNEFPLTRAPCRSPSRRTRGQAGHALSADSKNSPLADTESPHGRVRARTSKEELME